MAPAYSGFWMIPMNARTTPNAVSASTRVRLPITDNRRAVPTRSSARDRRAQTPRAYPSATPRSDGAASDASKGKIQLANESIVVRAERRQR